MEPTSEGTLNLIVVLGLALGAIFGLAGSVVHQASLRGLFWGIDGAGLVMAASLLTLKYFKKGRILVSAGFLIFAIGEGVILSGAAAGLAASVPSFAAGTILWAVALLFVSIPREFTTWARLLGLVSFVLFLVIALRIFDGAQILPTSKPLPFFAYPFLVFTFIGWIWTLLRENRVQPSASGSPAAGVNPPSA